MNSWQTKKIGECLSICYGKNQSLAEDDYGAFPILGSGGEIGRAKEFLYNKPSVLIGRKGTIDNPLYMDQPFWTVDTLFYSKINSGYSPKFIYYLFKTINWRRYNEASGVPSLSAQTISQIKVVIPDLAEQERIVGVLEAWDEYLEKLERKIKLKQIAKNYIARKIFNNNSFVPLKNIASKRKNAIVDGPFGSQMKVSEFVSCGVPVIEMHHLNNNAIDTNKITRFVEVEKFEKDLRRSSVKAGDIVISKTGSLGYVGLYLGKKEAVMTSRLAKITIDKKKADVDFILEYLSFIQQLKHWERVGQGGTMKILSIKHLESLPVPDVDVGMQEQLGGIIKTISFEIQLLKSKKSQIEQQKKFLLKKLVSGELRTPEDILEKGVSR